MIKYPCGCINEPHDPSGILHCVRKCRRHAAQYRDPATLDGRYYEELGVIKDGKLLPTKHAEELTEALGPFPSPTGYSVDPYNTMLEIGCGVSPYVADINAAGWDYIGLDSSPWVSEWMQGYWGTPCSIDNWDTTRIEGWFGLILCAHALEHMQDAPEAIAKMRRRLQPGGELWIVVPDDSDPVNPDHWWFMTEATLRSTLESAGLIVERIVSRKHVERESFIYARARRPG